MATETAAWDGVTDGALDLYRMVLRSETAVIQGRLQGMGGPGAMVNDLNLQYRPFVLEELQSEIIYIYNLGFIFETVID